MQDPSEKDEGEALQPLNTAPRPAPPRKKGKRRTGGVRVHAPKNAVSKALIDSWKQGLYVTDRELNEHIPTDVTVLVGEALLAGQLYLPGIIAYCGDASADKVKAVIQDPVSMAWISRQIHEHFKHRVALIDAALFTRAISGDVPAIKLWYERHGKLLQESTVHHKHTIGLDPATLSTEDLHRVVTENARLLANTTRIIDIRPVEGAAGGDVSGAAGTTTPVSGGAAPLLPSDAGQPPEAAGVPRGLVPGQQEVPVVCRGEPVGEDDSGEA